MSSLEQIYEQVYQKIIREREDIFLSQKKGVLYCILLELLGDQSLVEQNSVSKLIFSQVSDIKSSNSLDDDYKLIASLIKVILIDRQIGAESLFEQVKKVGSTGVKFIHFNHSNRDKQMKWFVIAGCMIVGVYVCIEYIKRQQNSAPQSSKDENRILHSPPSPPIPAALCLVVPASIASSFSGKLTFTQVKQLIDNASYFSCKRSSDADSREKNSLKITDEILPNDSQREVYLRIEIQDGKPMIDKTTRYELKENLKDSIEYGIVKKACLESLSGLESFVRV